MTAAVLATEPRTRRARLVALLVASALVLAGYGGGGGGTLSTRRFGEWRGLFSPLEPLWREAQSVVLYARPGAVAVRANLANFGASGFAGWDYIDAGFTK